MTEEEIRALVLEVLVQIAPETRGMEIDPDMNFRDQFDLDSLNFLDFMTVLDERLGMQTSELEYPKFSSLTGCVVQLQAQLRAKRGE
jgi:acyl carrier protein